VPPVGIDGTHNNMSRVAGFLEEIFEEFDRDKLSYCVMRQLTSCFHKEREVDVLIEPENLPRAQYIASKIAEKNMACCVFRASSKMHYHMNYYLLSEKLSDAEAVSIDFQFSVFEAGQIFSKPENIFKSLENDGTIFRPVPALEAAMVIVHSVVGKKYFKNDYWEHIRHQAQENPKELELRLEELTDITTAKLIMTAVRSEKPENVLKLREQLLCHRNKSKAHTLNLGKHLLSKYYDRWRRAESVHIAICSGHEQMGIKISNELNFAFRSSQYNILHIDSSVLNKQASSVWINRFVSRVAWIGVNTFRALRLMLSGGIIIDCRTSCGANEKFTNSIVARLGKLLNTKVHRLEIDLRGDGSANDLLEFDKIQVHLGKPVSKTLNLSCASGAIGAVAEFGLLGTICQFCNEKLSGIYSS